MMDKDEGSIGDISELSNVSDGEGEEIAMSRSPPSRGQLEKEANKLRSKFKILRQALHEEKLAIVNKRIGAIERDANPTVAEELSRLEAKRAERLLAAHERKRVRVESIVNEYKSRMQAINDERKAIEMEMLANVQAYQKTVKRAKAKNVASFGKKRTKKKKTSESDLMAEVEMIKDEAARRQIFALDASDFEYDSRELMHSD